ncbi:MAG: nicotinamide-nucleotide adenylyltransferase [Crenarchaeota archaeon]|nr:nicotinamide-nucleotide adenylyltransferase [Thermoproteota archaeon]
MTTRGLYVGRFQPFHLGHIESIKGILKEIEELIIVIGSAQYSHDVTNPFTSGERLTMIRNSIQEAKIDSARVWIIPVPDVHLHMMWVSEIEGYTPKFNLVYSNEPLTRRLFIEAGYEVKSLPYYDRHIFSSTIIRQKMLQQDESWCDLVPKNVAKFIREIDGVNRLYDINQTDKI